MKKLHGPWSLFDLLLYGLGFTALFPGTLLAAALYQRKRWPAFISLLAFNIIILLSFGWLTLISDFLWHNIILMTYGFNLVMSILIYLIQSRTIGKAAPVYRHRPWRDWLIPLFTGVILAYAITAFFSLGRVFSERSDMISKWDSLDRYTILVDIFSFGLWGIPVGLLLGIIWVGRKNENGFRVADLFAFLIGTGVFYCVIILMELLFFFILNGGEIVPDTSAMDQTWLLFPPWDSGFFSYLNTFHYWDPLSLLALAALVSSCQRIRDFAARLLLVFPIYLMILVTSFSSTERWQVIQHQILYNLSSNNEITRQVSAFFGQRLLHRYPDHLEWPYIAEQIGRSLLLDDRKEEADLLYTSIKDRYAEVPAWKRVTGQADLLLQANPIQPDHEIPLEMIDNEKYLTANWLALLTVIQFWQGDTVPESELKISLREISKDKKKISLPNLTHLAALDDAAANLGYQTIFLPNGAETLTHLISNGYPVILSRYNYFSVVNTLAGNREKSKKDQIVAGYSYFFLPKRFKKEVFKEIRELFNLEEDGKGEESQDRRERIKRLTRYWLPVADFDTTARDYAAPILTVVLPSEKIPELAATLNQPVQQLKDQSRGLLNSLISLSFIDQADPVQAIKWAMAGTEQTDHPLPLYCLHNSLLLWADRDRNIRSALDLEKVFSDLAETVDFFDGFNSTPLAAQAKERFTQDLAGQRPIPWMVLDQVIDRLDKNNAADRNELIAITELQMKLVPDSRQAILLADLYELSEDITSSLAMLRLASGMRPLDAELKLRLNLNRIKVDDYEGAEMVMETIDRSKVRFEADYIFYKAVINEWQGKTGKALDYYAAAITMRRYNPDYFFRYGKLLLAQGRNDDAQIALNWAAKIDSGSQIAAAVDKLLGRVP